MPFFQNPFPSDFIGVWVLADRHASLDFKCPRNAGRGDEIVTAYEQGPYNLSGNDSDSNSKAVLTLSYAVNDYRQWTDLAVTISASSLSATTPAEVVTSLNNNSTFADWFVASLDKFSNDKDRIVIKQKQPATKFRFYIKNGRAESVIRFNKLAGVAEMPSYFARHTIANRFNYADAQNALIQLATSGVDAAVINAAVDYKGQSLGLDAGSPKDDYVFLAGRSGLFMFQKNTVDSSSRITTAIIYQAGAKAGDLAKKITYTFSGSKTQPDSFAEVPYTLQSGDIITPP